MKFVILLTLALVVGCVSRPTLEQLEDEANTTGDWSAVEKREELIKERLESTAPGCPVGQRKKCYEEQSGIECYCLPSADEWQ
ncbi:MAG: hypothetical protein ACR2QI_10095 [Woeseiaceae bacterium]